MGNWVEKKFQYQKGAIKTIAKAYDMARQAHFNTKKVRLKLEEHRRDAVRVGNFNTKKVRLKPVPPP